MFQPRVIPCLLIRGNGLVKTRKFKNPVYLGDPINAVKIFSEKEADEIIILDIDASRLKLEPNFELIAEIAGEAFMPLAYGGGVCTLTHIKKLIRLGIEKIIINSAAIKSKELIKSAVEIYGSQAIVGAIDVKRGILGKVFTVTNSGLMRTNFTVKEHIDYLISAGVGEIFINDIDRDGMMEGFDIDLIRSIVNIPVPIVVSGGAGSIDHLRSAIIEGGASAVAAGSMFVFHGKHRAVLISYTKPEIF